MRRMKWTALIAAVVMMLSMLAVGASAAVALTVAPVSAAEIGGEVKVNVSLPAGSGVMGATCGRIHDRLGSVPHFGGQYQERYRRRQRCGSHLYRFGYRRGG